MLADSCSSALHCNDLLEWNQAASKYTVCTLDGLFQKLTKNVLQFIRNLFILKKTKQKWVYVFQNLMNELFFYKQLPGKVPPKYPRQGFKTSCLQYTQMSFLQNPYDILLVL